MRKGNMMQSVRMRARAAGVLAAGVLWVGSGCETVGAVSSSGSGDSYSYVMGDMYTTEETRLPRAFEAARTVLESSGYRVGSMTRDDEKGQISAQRGEGQTVQVALERRGLDKVRIQVRVGVVGDRAESKRILDEIRLRL